VTERSGAPVGQSPQAIAPRENQPKQAPEAAAPGATIEAAAGIPPLRSAEALEESRLLWFSYGRDLIIFYNLKKQRNSDEY